MEILFRSNSKMDKDCSYREARMERCPRCSCKNIGILVLFRKANWATCMCADCLRLFVVEGLGDNTLHIGSDEYVTTIPSPKSEYMDKIDKLPEDLRGSYKQAVKCFEIDCFDASAVMSRRVMQEIARAKIKQLKLSPKTNNLHNELKCLVDNKVIFPKTYDLYKNTKNIANFGAHPDEVDPTITVNSEEAELSLMVIELLIKEIYENDELYLKIEKSVNSKKQSKGKSN